MSIERSKTFDAGFRFAKLLGNADFRQHLKAVGYRSPKPTVIADSSEPVTVVLSRASKHSGRKGVMVAMELDGEPFGFALMFMKVARRAPWRRRQPVIDLEPRANVGEVYAALDRRGEYEPSIWIKPLLFECARRP